MCENQPEPRSCTTCPKYDGMKCTAADMLMGDREQVLQEEHRRGFICIDTGEAELKGDAAMKWAVEQQRCSEEQGFRSVTEMWEAQGKRVSEGWHDGPAVVVSPAGSPSSECPSLREGPPQKGKIDENSGLPGALEWRSETTCLNCRKSHREGLRLVCDRWGLQDILMPQRTCVEWKFDPNTSKAARDAGSTLSTVVDNASLDPGRIGYVEGSGLQYVENTPPLFIRDPNGYWEPVKPRSCTTCKFYNDPICMKIGTHIGNKAQIWQREDLYGFQCIAALPKEERMSFITSSGCNNRKEIR